MRIREAQAEVEQKLASEHSREYGTQYVSVRGSANSDCFLVSSGRHCAVVHPQGS